MGREPMTTPTAEQIIRKHRLGDLSVRDLVLARRVRIARRSITELRTYLARLENLLEADLGRIADLADQA